MRCGAGCCGLVSCLVVRIRSYEKHNLSSDTRTRPYHTKSHDTPRHTCLRALRNSRVSPAPPLPGPSLDSHTRRPLSQRLVGLSPAPRPRLRPGWAVIEAVTGVGAPRALFTVPSSATTTERPVATPWSGVHRRRYYRGVVTPQQPPAQHIALRVCSPLTCSAGGSLRPLPVLVGPLA